jgi:hypothetical protein
MNMRTLDRNLLASFIEYAASGVVTPGEWQRFAVDHYQDEAMEQARIECVRIFHSATDGSHLSGDQRSALYRLAKALRGAV